VAQVWIPPQNRVAGGPGLNPYPKSGAPRLAFETWVSAQPTKPSRVPHSCSLIAWVGSASHAASELRRGPSNHSDPPSHCYRDLVSGPKARSIPAWGEAPGHLRQRHRGLKARSITLLYAINKLGFSPRDSIFFDLGKTPLCQNFPSALCSAQQNPNAIAGLIHIENLTRPV
jgi:hypothetical protein